MTIEPNFIDFTKIPFDDIQLVGTKSMLHSKMFTISWLLGRFCNYKCSYCWPYARADKKDHRPTELCLNTIDEIKRQARANGFNSFNWSLSGGEPTFHPGYLDILQYLADDNPNCKKQRIHMTSNCSRKMSWFETYVKYAKQFDRASITASSHFEHLNTQDKIAEFTDKLVFCQDNGIRITINMVMVPERFDLLMDHVMYFKSRGIHTTLKPQSNPTATKVVEGYTKEQLDILHNDSKTPTMEIELIDSKGEVYEMDQAERFNAFEFNNFKGWICSSGFRGCIIREPCGSIKRSYSCRDVPLGNIETGFKLFDSPQPCISDACVSSADSKIPKRKPNVKLPLWPGDNTYETS